MSFVLDSPSSMHSPRKKAKECNSISDSILLQDAGSPESDMFKFEEI